MAVRKKQAPRMKLDALALAREAGLEKAVKRFPADVAAAAQAAVQARGAMPGPDNAGAEPWPPMRMRGMP
jgi:hypothetical protein